jgi:hypothetical protein
MINLYYDKIIDGVPAPNGSTNIGLTSDARRIPYVRNWGIESPINPVNTFYFVMKANKLVIKLYTEKQKAKNLFYPIELSDSMYSWNRDLTQIISPRARQLIKKGRMKLLILAPMFVGNYWKANEFKKRLFEIVDSGIPKDNIYVILGDIKCTYKHLLGLRHVYGIDWGQIYSQIIYKVRFGQSDLEWIAPQHKDFLFNANDKLIDHNNWNNKFLFNVTTTNYREHDISLYLELEYRDLLKHGNYIFNISNYKVTELNDNHINPRAPMLEKQYKRNIYKNLKTSTNSNNTDILAYSNSLLENTVVSIICDDVFVDTYTPYRDEIAVMAPGFKIWQNIALGHPFMILGSVDTMNYLNNQGYFSCNELINQSYDSVYNAAKRSSEIVNNLQSLHNSSEELLISRMKESIPYLKKNQQIFFERTMQSTFLELFVDIRYE